MNANAEMTAPAAVRPTPNSRGVDRIAGAYHTEPHGHRERDSRDTPSLRAAPPNGCRRVISACVNDRCDRRSHRAGAHAMWGR